MANSQITFVNLSTYYPIKLEEGLRLSGDIGQLANDSIKEGLQYRYITINTTDKNAISSYNVTEHVFYKQDRKIIYKSNLDAQNLDYNQDIADILLKINSEDVFFKDIMDISNDILCLAKIRPINPKTNQRIISLNIMHDKKTYNILDQYYGDERITDFPMQIFYDRREFMPKKITK